MKIPTRDDLGSTLRDIERRLGTLERSPQLTHSSVGEGAFKVLDSSGNEVIILGKDGTRYGFVSKDPATSRQVRITSASPAVFEAPGGDSAETQPTRMKFVFDDPTYGDYFNVESAKYGGGSARLVLKPESSGGDTSRAVMFLLAGETDDGEIIAQPAGSFTSRAAFVYPNVQIFGWTAGNNVAVSSNHTFTHAFASFNNSPNAACGVNGADRDEIHVQANGISKTGLTLRGKNVSGATASFTLVAVPIAL